MAQVATLIDDDFPFRGPIDYVSNDGRRRNRHDPTPGGARPTKI